MTSNHKHSDCVKSIIEKAEQVCDKNSLKLTPIRRKVLEVIIANHKPTKAYDILTKLKDSGFSDKPPTVYRALDFLIENKIVHKLNTLNAYIACFSDKIEEICYFLICEKCQNIEEIRDKKLVKTLANIGKDKKADIKSVCLEIGFRCEECRGV